MSLLFLLGGHIQIDCIPTWRPPVERGPTLTRVLLLLLAAALFAPGPAVPAAGERPNVVFILTDNHGAWTLGCYGNRDIRTPNIDRLAAEGMLFEHAYSSNPVCSPTRATYLTGLIPSQHGVHRYLAAGGAQVGPRAYDTLAEFRTLPKILAEAGYVCGLAGKWHLGGNLQPQEGFTTWATMPHGHTTTFYDAEVIENGAIRTEPTYLTDFWTRRGVEFIRKNRDRPFFLYLAYNGPYGLGPSMLQPARNRHAAEYADKELSCFPREPAHPWLNANKNLLNQPAAMRRYAAEISGVDDGVGEVMAALKELGLDEKTLVVFAGDQGLAAGQNGLWGMGDHTRPLTLYDLTLDVPLIFRQPGRVVRGRTPIQVSNYDFLPSLLGYLGMTDQLPGQPRSPGRDYSPTLRGERQEWENVTFHEFENTRAVRTPEWKYIERIHEEPNELYDLRADPQERKNLAGQPEQAGRQADLRTRLHTFFDRTADPKYDLWKGGTSKSALSTAKLFGLEIREGRDP